jgi:uncharacterized protein YaaQ
MPQPIKVRGRFLTASETAELLGVPKKRAQFLISMVEDSTGTRKARRTRSPKSESRHATTKTRVSKKTSAKASHK